MLYCICSISSLVYSMRTENIVSVMCNGKWIMQDNKILNVDEVLSHTFSLIGHKGDYFNMNFNSRLTGDDVFALVFHILLCKQILCEEVYKLQLISVSFTQEFHVLLVAGWQENVISMAKQASAEILKRAGINIPSRMNFVWWSTYKRCFGWCSSYKSKCFHKKKNGKRKKIQQS